MKYSHKKILETIENTIKSSLLSIDDDDVFQKSDAVKSAQKKGEDCISSMQLKNAIIGTKLYWDQNTKDLYITNSTYINMQAIAVCAVTADESPTGKPLFVSRKEYKKGRYFDEGIFMPVANQLSKDDGWHNTQLLAKHGLQLHMHKYEPLNQYLYIPSLDELYCAMKNAKRYRLLAFIEHHNYISSTPSSANPEEIWYVSSHCVPAKHDYDTFVLEMCPFYHLDNANIKYKI